MDVMMPEMDGLEATRRIRNEGQPFSKVPIIALTAKAMSDDRDLCIKAGANDYVAKPLNVEILLSLVRVWLHKR
jgi:CheY-like chemotaxis protein